MIPARCTEPALLMSGLSLWALWPLLTWLIVQEVQPLEGVKDPLQLTSNPLGPTEPWSSRSSSRPWESLHGLSSPADLGGSDYLGSSASSQRSAPPQELTENLVQFRDRARELPPGPEHSRQERLPEVGPMPDWDQKQTLVQPPCLKSRVQTADLDQAADHQADEILVPPLDSKVSKAMESIVSPKNLKKDLAQHWRLAKVVGIPHHYTSKFVLLQDILYPGSLPPELQVNSDEPPGPPMEPELSPSEQEQPAQPSESSRELEPSQTQEETLAQPPEEMDPSVIQEETPTEPPGSPMEPELSPSEQEQPAQPSESSGELESSPAQQEATVQALEPPKEVESSSQQMVPAHYEVTLPHPDRVHSQHSNLTQTTVQPLDLGFTVTPESTTEVEPSSELDPMLIKDILYPSSLPPELQVNSDEPPGPPMEPELSLSEQEQPAQPSESSGELEPSQTQEETLAQPPEEMEPSVIQEETPTEPPGPPMEPELSPSEQEQPAQPSESSRELEPSQTQEETLAQPPEEMEPSVIQEETPTEPPGPPMEPELSPSEQEQPAQPSEPSGELESSPAHQEATVQALEPPKEVEPSSQQMVPAHYEVTLPHPDHVQTRHSNLTQTTVQPLDLGLTVTPESTTEVEPSTVLTTTAPPPKQPEVTLPPSPKGQAQHSNLTQLTVQPLDLGLTIAPESTTEVEPSTVLTTTAPPPKHPEVTLPPSDKGQTQHQNLTEVTGPPTKLEPTQDSLVKPETYALNGALTARKEQASASTNICDLCTCRDEMLSCIALSPKQRLRHVPVPEPNTYNGTFTI
ncbi:hypothetical protein P7K49_010832, partial [Saguinus oedipus]